jgi:hypothetical protein
MIGVKRAMDDIGEDYRHMREAARILTESPDIELRAKRSFKIDPSQQLEKVTAPCSYRITAASMFNFNPEMTMALVTRPAKAINGIPSALVHCLMAEYERLLLTGEHDDSDDSLPAALASWIRDFADKEPWLSTYDILTRKEYASVAEKTYVVSDNDLKQLAA